MTAKRKFYYCKFSTYPYNDKCNLYSYEGNYCFHVFCPHYEPDPNKGVEIEITEKEV